MISIREVQTSDAALAAYADLFRRCFPGATIADPAYLTWLYKNNPDGTVVGLDAWDDDTLAAHYATIPTTFCIDGHVRRCLLSLNTATDPRYQGKGMFTQLASDTYHLAKNLGYAAVYGVANANSTPGFVHKLSFQLVAPLAAKLGFGRLTRRSWEQLAERTAFRHHWREESLRWRITNPRGQVRLKPLSSGGLAALAPTGRPGMMAYGEIPMVNDWPQDHMRNALGGLSARVFIGLMPDGGGSCYGPIPNALKPSPLNLIYRSLDPAQAPETLEAARTLITFLDFDAF